MDYAMEFALMSDLYDTMTGANDYQDAMEGFSFKEAMRAGGGGIKGFFSAVLAAIKAAAHFIWTKLVDLWNWITGKNKKGAAAPAPAALPGPSARAALPGPSARAALPAPSEKAALPTPSNKIALGTSAGGRLALPDGSRSRGREAASGTERALAAAIKAFATAATQALGAATDTSAVFANINTQTFGRAWEKHLEACIDHADKANEMRNTIEKIVVESNQKYDGPTVSIFYYDRNAEATIKPLIAAAKDLEDSSSKILDKVTRLQGLNPAYFPAHFKDDVNTLNKQMNRLSTDIAYLTGARISVGLSQATSA